MIHPHDPLEARLTAALEAPPKLHIPANFAARVTAKAPAPAVIVTPRRASVGRYSVLAAAAVLLVAMFAFAPWAHSGGSLTVEFSLAAEFVALVTFLSLRPASLR